MSSDLLEKPANQAAEPPGYQMPVIFEGMTVIHRPSGDPPTTRGTVMIVTKRGTETVNGSLVPDGNSVLYPLSGVRHVSDPLRRDPRYEQNGTWDYTRETKLLIKLAVEMGLDVEKELSKLG